MVVLKSSVCESIENKEAVDINFGKNTITNNIQITQFSEGDKCYLFQV